MQRIFRFEDKEIPVVFGQDVVRIDNNERLWVFINVHPAERTKMLVDWIQKNYEETFGGRLKISDNSFVMEIWGHIYFEYFMLRNKRTGRLLFPFGLYKLLVTSCEEIDCGESEIDTNRWLWDMLGIFTPILGRIIPKNSLE